MSVYDYSATSKSSTVINNSEYHYHTIFGRVCSTRFQKLAKFIFTSSWILSFILLLPSSSSWIVKVLPIRTIPLAIGFFLLACLKKNNLHVDFLGYRTLSNQVLGQLLNKKFALTFLIYWVSSLLYFIALHSPLFSNLTLKATPKKHQYPQLNDQFVFYYFFTFFIALVYSLYHSILDKDRLVFRYGHFHEHPKDALINKIPSIVSNSILFTVLAITSGPFIYIFARNYLYDFLFVIVGIFYSLNHSYPSLSFSLYFYVKLSIISFFLLVSWESLNAAFNAYLSIGCLHRGRTLSELSKDPLNTLLTGLRSNKELTKLTAFQELAYIAKIDDSEGRLAIYNRNNRREAIWKDILHECEKVLKQNNSNINSVLSKNFGENNIVDSKFEISKKRDQNIFGRDYYNPIEKNDDYLSRPKIPSYSDDSQSFLDNNIITLIVDNTRLLNKLINEYYHRFITSGFGIPFRYTALRESERLCPIPVTVGNAIIAISLISTHAYEEDKRGTVSATITDILDILEKSVSTCGKFISNYPKYLVETDGENIITLLHELSMNAFFEVTIKYNDVLKDAVLSPDVYKLVNWILENAFKDDPL
ncbi:hypothetical protein WICMUC_005709 [Wickerhamomyces mucosus]|uniref:Nucleoporin NDC1 n=1 Tax=Wickerhamomyces mucosus TaxID=1378264 RepID=A0A9P8T5Z1_9ASCO|nr:hypothetical protein WICMUC_005709 [Wickerhamomyces mucosus]